MVFQLLMFLSKLHLVSGSELGLKSNFIEGFNPDTDPGPLATPTLKKKVTLGLLEKMVQVVQEEFHFAV